MNASTMDARKIAYGLLLLALLAWIAVPVAVRRVGEAQAKSAKHNAFIKKIG